MHARVFALTTLFLLLLQATPSLAQERSVERLVDATAEGLTGSLKPLAGAGGPTCQLRTISCGQTVNAALTPSDCDLGDGFFADFWVFQGGAGDEVTINMGSNDFDTILGLLNPVPALVAEDDDGGPGTNSRIVHTLDLNGQWAIAATHFFPNELGNYTLSLACSPATGPQLPPESPGEGFDTGDTSPCVPGPTTLCLSGDRFQVDVDFRTPQGTTGEGMAKVLTPDTGYFWFFNEENVEMVVKVLDTCDVPQFNRFWVFAGGLTNVEVEMVVRDTENGLARRYTNPLRTPFQPLQDTQAFGTCR